jgi:hypothetical protein
MRFIRLPVGNVVQDVDGTRDEAKTDKSEGLGDKILRVEQVFGKNERSNQKQVFDPLMRAEYFNVGAQGKSRVQKTAGSS